MEDERTYYKEMQNEGRPFHTVIKLKFEHERFNPKKEQLLVLYFQHHYNCDLNNMIILWDLYSSMTKARMELNYHKKTSVSYRTFETLT